MANMLIRTRQLQCKFRLAVFIRVILFFGIPSFYFLFLRVNNVNEDFTVTKPDSYAGIFTLK